MMASHAGAKGEVSGGDAADAQQRQIRALFDEFDRDKKGRLTLGQLGLKREGLWTLLFPR
jgi:hypothetical protein